jgi:hypothetical protein
VGRERRGRGAAGGGRVGSPSRYRAELLADARPGRQGIVHAGPLGEARLAWGRVRRAFAAEVGEPEGVRTLVFDLVVGIAGGECASLRFDRDPGADAQAAARAIVRALGPDLCDPSLLAVAVDGYATRSHPDLEAFEEACLEALRAKPV